jgi:hypothetical protein
MAVLFEIIYCQNIRKINFIILYYKILKINNYGAVDDMVVWVVPITSLGEFANLVNLVFLMFSLSIISIRGVRVLRGLGIVTLPKKNFSPLVFVISQDLARPGKTWQDLSRSGKI